MLIIKNKKVNVIGIVNMTPGGIETGCPSCGNTYPLEKLKEIKGIITKYLCPNCDDLLVEASNNSN